jgi:hypothetical protein
MRIFAVAVLGLCGNAILTANAKADGLAGQWEKRCATILETLSPVGAVSTKPNRVTFEIPGQLDLVVDDATEAYAAQIAAAGSARSTADDAVRRAFAGEAHHIAVRAPQTSEASRPLRVLHDAMGCLARTSSWLRPCLALLARADDSSLRAPNSSVDARAAVWTVDAATYLVVRWRGVTLFIQSPAKVDPNNLPLHYQSGWARRSFKGDSWWIREHRYDQTTFSAVVQILIQAQPTGAAEQRAKRLQALADRCVD